MSTSLERHTPRICLIQYRLLIWFGFYLNLRVCHPRNQVIEFVRAKGIKKAQILED